MYVPKYYLTIFWGHEKKISGKIFSVLFPSFAYAGTNCTMTICPSNNNTSNTRYIKPSLLLSLLFSKKEKKKEPLNQVQRQSKRHQPLFRLNTQTKPLSQHLSKRQLGLFVDQLF